MTATSGHIAESRSCTASRSGVPSFSVSKGLKNHPRDGADRLGAQLIDPSFSTTSPCGGEWERAFLETERVSREQRCLLVRTNLGLPENEQIDCAAVDGSSCRRDNVRKPVYFSLKAAQSFPHVQT